jgi:hypothetical protein
LLDISSRNAFFLPFFFFMDHKVRERRPLGLYKEICIMLRGPSSVGTSIRNGNAFVMQMQKVVILLLLFYLYIYTGTPSIYIVLCFYATSSSSSSSAPSALTHTHTHTHTQSLLRSSPFATRRKNATDRCCYYKIINYNIAQKCAMRRCRA